ncbi:MAG: hypothetical protein IT214_05380 [Chitinophagaceae bacterium]|jgi:hypothetical protein|nr:hypothetical protein [Chitinophagaceae bacterium]OQY94337.1 MAG: hypothetical protein B6D37_08770 [Sphingobacteriales bacterium UTBCD1]
MKGSIYRSIFVAALFIAPAIAVHAQDSTKRRTVNITSTFKPVLREAAKINFNANPPAADTSKPVLKYEIPDQNLLFGYQPGSLKPLALQIDSGGKWDNSNYIKAGFGSLKTPYIQTGFSFGDGRNIGLNIYAKHVSSDGTREFQKFSTTDVKLDGFYKTPGNLEWDASLEMKQDGTYKYGFEPETLNFPRDSLKQNFQTIGGTVGLHNINLTPMGLSYSPLLKINVFTDNHKNSESNTVLDLPLQKTIGQVFGAKLDLNFDLTRLSPKGKSAINNTTYSFSPSLLFKTPNINLQAGIRPSWDNRIFKMFPNIMADVGTDDSRFTFQAGWIGYIRKTTYQYLASQNPWLWMPSSLNNTWIEERYAGFKGSVGDYFSYSAKVGFNKLNNQPLFVNDTTPGFGGKSFVVVNEPQIRVLTLGGELGFTLQEKFSMISSLNFNQYSHLAVNKAAWGLLPVEFNTSIRLQAVKDLWFKTDVFAWTGPKYMRQNGNVGTLKGAFDLNAGLEFRISQYLNIWTQFNNILNRQYQRWNQYPVYGFNFLAGVVFSFNQKN